MYKIVLIRLILLITVGLKVTIHATKSEFEFESTQIQALGERLFRQLGLQNQTSLHRMSKRSVSFYDTEQNAHMYQLYNRFRRNKPSKNTSASLSEPYNLIRSFFGESACSGTKSCGKSRVKTYFKPKRRHVQRMRLSDEFEFDTSLLDSNIERIVNADLSLEVDLTRLLRSKLLLNTRSTHSHLNELKVEFVVRDRVLNTYLSRQRVSFKYKVVELVQQLHKVKRFKFQLKKMLEIYSRNHTSGTPLKLGVSLNAEFSSGLKAYELDSRLSGLNVILVKKPALTVFLDDGSAAHDFGQDTFSQHFSQPNENKCKRRPFLVNFRDVGWDKLIVEPKYLKSFYCDGSCDMPMDGQFRGSNHAILRSLASKVSAYDFLPRVCCTPDKLSSTMFLFVDENNSLVLKRVSNILVESCSCQ